jgi:EpsI family protein
MISRMIVVSLVLLSGAGLIATASKTEQVPPRRSLEAFPVEVGDWTGRREPDFDREILDVLGVDEYISRLYRSKSGYAGLYIGYYRSQRQGDTIHSPLNCLPGAGWEPLSKTYLPIEVRSDKDSDGLRSVTVNRYVIQKGLDKQVVLYWYQSHGRVIANEYRSKIFMVYDAVRLNRTDASLVRVISPQIGSGPDAEEAASASAVSFVKTIFPLLGQYLS